MKKKVTIRDVAKECGYSIFTVSSALNNRGNIKPETCEKVLAAAKKLNYNVLQNVSAVQRMRTRSIGIVLPDSGCLNNAFYNRAISTFRDAATVHDYDCKLFTEEDISKRLGVKQPDSAHALGCKGLIYFCPRTNYSKVIDALINQSVAVALIRRPIPERKGLLQLVDDDRAGMMTMLNYVHHQLNCTRLAYVTGRPLAMRSKAGREIAIDEFIAANQTVTAHAIIDGSLANDPVNSEQLIQFLQAGRDAGQKTALVCWTDSDAVPAVGVATQAGFRVPDEVCVTGYNDDPQSRNAYPGITTMQIPVEDMVADATRYLIDFLDDDGLPRSRVIQFQHDLIVRGSTEHNAAATNGTRAS
ncbi:LacI family DNA-binding transcriptional regulator [Cerasicoccus fimbriatus]|uniref:LacI family DNA-binding transcriptional regulator n=1 Tax=Cerasicoccus fimbriatus TaxID=3014554 RepID=UPI0022B45FD2|nr:LacI family DNA-binding transcriptional regulator [Cerasicoccus sp. TK19100]